MIPLLTRGTDAVESCGSFFLHFNLKTDQKGNTVISQSFHHSQRVLHCSEICFQRVRMFQF